jgi:hypothetical protein
LLALRADRICEAILLSLVRGTAAVPTDWSSGMCLAEIRCAPTWNHKDPMVSEVNAGDMLYAFAY